MILMDGLLFIELCNMVNFV